MRLLVFLGFLVLAESVETGFKNACFILLYQLHCSYVGLIEEPLLVDVILPSLEGLELSAELLPLGLHSEYLHSIENACFVVFDSIL